jgi:SAM-dependent methyltransferase
MVSKTLIEQWKKDEHAPFFGWDFSYLNGRWNEEQPPWNYEKLAKSLVRKSKSTLDMATGGGEIFSTFAPFAGRAIAIEGYKPNLPIAKKRLAPLGVKVIESAESGKLPFESEEFDLILNRHGAFQASEINNKLKNGGRFLTQQVGGDSLIDLMTSFKAKTKWPDHRLGGVEKAMAKNGFKIKRAEEWKGRLRFKDVGAIVYFLKAVPWLVDGFDVNTHLKYLKILQERLEEKEELAFRATKFLIYASKGDT